jgi:hypothetical protein
MDVVEQLDAILLGDYIKRKAEILSEIIQTGVLSSQVDWLTAPKPTGPYHSCYRLTFDKLIAYDIVPPVIILHIRRELVCLRRSINPSLGTLSSHKPCRAGAV